METKTRFWKERLIVTELKQFLQSHSNTAGVEVMMPDNNGIIRGKRIDIHEAESLFEKGLNFCAATPLLDSGGDVIDGLILGSDDGDPDIFGHPIDGSLTPVPWLEKEMAQVLITLVDRDGNPYPHEARNVLSRVIKRLADDDLHATIAVELEFYLYSDHDGLMVMPRHSPTPGTILHQAGPQVYSLEDLRELDPFFNRLQEICDQQNIPVGTAISEFSTGQFETNLHHVSDALLGCDQSMLLRRAVKETAREFGMGATFMAKPFLESAGSGMHIHVSLKDGSGNPVFAHDESDSTGFNENLQNAVGGLAETMKEGMAIFCPNANSYRRFAPGFFAPITPNWGPNHRNLSLRIPLSDDDNVRIEHRSAGADANPYLVVASVLAGMHAGLKQKISPPEMIQESEVIDPEVTLPVKWQDALDEFNQATILPQYFDEEFCRIFHHCRSCELDRFSSQISNKDFEWYLRSI